MSATKTTVDIAARLATEERDLAARLAAEERGRQAAASADWGRLAKLVAAGSPDATEEPVRDLLARTGRTAADFESWVRAHRAHQALIDTVASEAAWLAQRDEDDALLAAAGAELAVAQKKFDAVAVECQRRANMRQDWLYRITEAKRELHRSTGGELAERLAARRGRLHQLERELQKERDGKDRAESQMTNQKLTAEARAESQAAFDRGQARIRELWALIETAKQRVAEVEKEIETGEAAAAKSARAVPAAKPARGGGSPPDPAAPPTERVPVTRVS